MLNFRRIWALLVVMCFVFIPGTLWASDPLRMAFVDASVSGGKNAYSTILEFLEVSDDIKVKDSEKIWDAADAVGIARKDFRNGKRREASTKEFRQVMKKLDIESIVILDVFSKGRKLQLVVIGPSGEEVADVRRDIQRGRPTKAQARDILKEAFGTLVPEVVSFREKGGWDAYDDAPKVAARQDYEEEEEEEDEDTSGDIRDRVVAKRQGDFGLEPGFNLRFGALIGSRSFNMTSEGGFALDHKSPFVGVFGRVEALLSVFSEGSAGIGLAAFGGYAPFTTLFDQNEEFPSDYGRIGGELFFVKAFSPDLRMNIFGGAEMWSVTIAKNRFYTGNQYTAARVGLTGIYTTGPIALFAGGALLPTFGINNSDEAFGETELTFGFDGHAGLTFKISDAIDATVGYKFRTISPDHPTPKVIGTPENPDPISSSDTLHIGTITLGYQL